MYSSSEAAAAVGKSKSAILRAIKAGKISATRDENDQFQIDPAELHRVYPKKSANASPQKGKAEPERTASGRGAERLKMQLEHLEMRIGDQLKERDRERTQMQDTIDDLRDRLTAEAKRGDALQTRLLTDERLQSKPRGLFGLRKKASH